MHAPVPSYRYANPALCLPPPIGVGMASVTLTKEASMPGITLRAFRALFPRTTRPVSTLPNEAEARALAALLVAQGQRALIHRTATGFAVEVLA